MRLVWTIIGLLILFPGYLYIRYQAIDSCDAALIKAAREQPDAVERVKAILAKRDLQGIGMCYRIATVGAQSATTPAPLAG